MSKMVCYLLSPRQLDHSSIELLALENGWEFQHPSRPSHLLENPDPSRTIVFWDVDHDSIVQMDHPFSLASVRRVLEKGAHSERVFAIGDLMPYATPALFRQGGFSHYLLRRFCGPAIGLFSRLAMASTNPYPFGLDLYVPPNQPIQRVPIDNSSKRKSAVQALENVLIKKGVLPRIANRVANATDELLLNALFDAPRDDQGIAYRHGLDRAESFPLTSAEQIELLVSLSPTYGAITVADGFGNLEREKVMSFLQKNLKDENAESHGEVPGSGLGIYGVLESGLSLLLLAHKGTCTEAVLFFPMTGSIKEFRDGFRFFSFIEKRDS